MSCEWSETISRTHKFFICCVNNLSRTSGYRIVSDHSHYIEVEISPGLVCNVIYISCTYFIISPIDNLFFQSKMSHMFFWFWNPDFWLPPNITWETFIEEKLLIKPQHFARFSDLWYSLPLGLCFIVIRFIVEKMLVKPIGCSLGLSDKPRRQPRENKVLESYFKSKSKLSNGDALSLSRKCGLSEIQVHIQQSGSLLLDYIFFCIFSAFFCSVMHYFWMDLSLQCIRFFLIWSSRL